MTKTKKRGRGRPMFAVTDALREKVENLVAFSRMTQDQIAEAIGCDAKTLVRHFKDELEAGRARAKARVFEMIWASAKRGTVQSMILLANIASSQPLDGRANNRPINRPLRLGKKELARIEGERTDPTNTWVEPSSPPKLIIDNTPPEKR